MCGLCARAAFPAWILIGLGFATTALGADSAPGRAWPPAATGQGPAALTLADLEQIAAQGNPTLAQAAASVEIARGRALQSGLFPNPTIGYSGSEIGNEGTAGFQGAFIDQLIPIGGKLRLNRARFAQEVSQMEAQALAQQYRVLNGVRMRYYDLLARQRLIELRGQLRKVAEDALVTTQELVNVGQANRADLLEARIEARQERVGLENARTRYGAAWKELAALVGNPCLPVTPLAGSLEEGPPVPCWDAALAHLLEASPEMAFAVAEVRKGQYGLRREQVEPIPNLRVTATPRYSYESNRMTADAQVGFVVPLFDRNQGNIRAAQGHLARAQAEVDRVRLSLEKRLAGQFARYQTARAVAEELGQHSLPDAREAFNLYIESFRRSRAAYPQVLIAQREYFRLSTDYVQALEEQRRAEVAILGLLLTDGLEEPEGPAGEVRFERRQKDREPAEELRDPISGQEGRSLEERLGQHPSSAGQ